ncbi:MAG: hypothetical protein AAFP97_13570 [Pseudomonadota bacterium]
MSYQFDTTQFRPETKAQLEYNTARVRLLARRTARQSRRSLRAI